MCVFGIVANVINIQLFRKQGFRGGVNVTLTSLAVSDLGAVIFELVYFTVINPHLLERDWVISKAIIGIISAFTHEYFSRVSSVVTAFEICLCVTCPLKVKVMITTKVAIMVNASIFIIYWLYLFPQFYVVDFDWALISERNVTVYVVYTTARSAIFSPMTYYFTDILFPYCTFIILVSSCTILFVKLKSKARWRNRVSSSGQGLSQVTVREQKSCVVFMAVSLMCVVLLLPQYLLFTALTFIRALAFNGYFVDVRKVVYAFTRVFKTANSSFTIFIYYNMSTKYRSEFHKMFTKQTKAEHL
ncbi:hypothetical protein Bpfe_016041 [Biomphalaria pfeifferi]|uniref:G-protein coupled receptors family 1 profile domain-containing protein n=1 Tax=Biomphalaria pfeifferi TaxID=112525 RepID=A0AAD8BJ48_BIOPF|nr:hypothetical protein Bpfe_016041 [Biomphalaria pfeifferi]